MPTKKIAPEQTTRARGRPALQHGEDTVPVTIRMTNPQKDKLQRLGGPTWVRTRIDKAREPGEKA